MSGRVRRSLALALAGLLAGLGLVLALFGGESVRHLIGRDEPGPPAASKPESGLRSLADPGAMAGRADPTIDFRDDKPARAEPGQPTGASPSPSPQEVRIPGPGAPGRAAEPDAAETPRFDIVRVEPNGEAVVAGRGAPHAVVEMLVNGKPVARATADANGQFAIVPPALPTGSSVVGLRMTGRDGRAASSQQSVAVDVAPGRDRQPLVALTAPDAATVVLSQPGAPAPAAAPGAPGARIADAAPPDRPEAGRAVGAPGPRRRAASPPGSSAWTCRGTAACS